MAGNYPDPPGNRLPYDRDGTQVYAGSNYGFDVVGAPMPAAEITAMNDEGTTTYGDGASVSSSGTMYIIFPTLRDITHVLFSPFNGGGAIWEWSADTTNGIDGTWTGITVPMVATNRIAMRSSISPLALNGVKALRWREANGGVRTYTLHLYGKPTNPGDRLEFWHPTLDQPLRDTPGLLDWGDRPRNTQATKQVRVKNRSGSLTAQSVTVGMEVLTDASPSLLTQHEFSLDGSPFAPNVTLGDLTPGQVSGLIEVRQQLTLTTALSLWDQRLVADAAGWV